MHSLKPPALKYERMGSLLTRNIPAREYLMEPWLKEGESALVYAAPGVGKSMLTLTLALALAGGGTFLDWKSPAPRRVLLVDGEMATADLQERGRTLLPTVAGLDVPLMSRNLIVLARQDQNPDAIFPDLATPEGQRAILQRVKRDKIDLLLLDNFSTLFTCEDENAAAAFNDVVAFLMRLKQARVGCILVHHTSKGGDNYRGSSKLATTFEVILGLTKNADTRDDKGTAFEMTWDKFRGKKRDEVTTPRSVHLEEIQPGTFRWVAKAATRSHLAKLIEAVQSQEFRTHKALAEHFKVDPSQITRWKKAAIHTYHLIKESDWDSLMGSRPDPGEGPEEF